MDLKDSPEEMAERIIALEKAVQELEDSVLSEEDVQALEVFEQEEAADELLSEEDVAREIGA